MLTFFSFKWFSDSKDRSLVKITSKHLNRNLVLNLCVFFLQSVITLIANFFSMKIMMVCFLVYLLIRICFIWPEIYFALVLQNVLWYNTYFIYYSLNHNIPLLIYYCFYTIFMCVSAYINHISIFHISIAFSGFFSFISYFINTLATKKNLSQLICKSIKDLYIKASTVRNLFFANNTLL